LTGVRNGHRHSLESSSGASAERQRRIGENEALLRQVNEGFLESAGGYSAITGTVFVMCECGGSDCVRRIEMTPGEYEALRAESTHFAIAHGHELPDVETIVHETPRYAIVRRMAGLSAAIAEETDPRNTNPGT
jgi:hypothetical protein